jgi:pimeloyl-ACP methyl ester carboxylesterase
MAGGQASFSTAAWAALGPLLPRNCGLSLADGDPRVVKGVGHNLQQEAPQAFAEAVVEVDGY